MQKIFSRAFRGALFDRKAFAEVFWDDDAVADGVIVVASVSVVTFILSGVFFGFGFSFVAGLLQTAVSAVASWLILSAATWFASTRLFKTGGGVQTMMATHGLAYLPTLVFLLPFGIAALVGLVWYLGVLVVATREATSSDTRNAVLSVLVGFAFTLIIQAVFRLPFTAASALSGLF